MLVGSNVYHRVVSAESTIKDHLDIHSSRNEVFKALSSTIKKVVSKKNNPVIMTSLGETLGTFYSKDLRQKAWLSPNDPDFIDLKGITFVLTDEFIGTKRKYNMFLDKFINKLPDNNRPLRVLSFNGDN